jgi:hypothetical protein
MSDGIKNRISQYHYANIYYEKGCEVVNEIHA